MAFKAYTFDPRKRKKVKLMASTVQIWPFCAFLLLFQNLRHRSCEFFPHYRHPVATFALIPYIVLSQWQMPLVQPYALPQTSKIFILLLAFLLLRDGVLQSRSYLGGVNKRVRMCLRHETSNVPLAVPCALYWLTCRPLTLSSLVVRGMTPTSN